MTNINILYLYTYTHIRIPSVRYTRTEGVSAYWGRYTHATLEYTYIVYSIGRLSQIYTDWGIYLHSVFYSSPPQVTTSKSLPAFISMLWESQTAPALQTQMFHREQAFFGLLYWRHSDVCRKGRVKASGSADWIPTPRECLETTSGWWFLQLWTS